MRNIVCLATIICLTALAAVGPAVASETAVSPQSAVCDLKSADAVTIPQMLSYQGKLTDTLGQPVPNGNYQLTFRLYTVPSGGSPFWTEGQTILVRNGLFSALLGAVTPISSVPDAGALYMSLQVAIDPELSPRSRIASAAYAFAAQRADSAYRAGSAPASRPITPPVGTGEIADNAVRGSKIAAPCSLFSSAGSPHAVLHIKSQNNGDGIRVDSAAGNGVVVSYAYGFGVQVESAATAGVAVSRAAMDGLVVGTTGASGLYTINAGAWGVSAYGTLGGGHFKPNFASGVGLEADAYNDVATDTAIRAHGRGYATGGWYTGGMAGGASAPCVVSPEQVILAHGSARLAGGKAGINFPGAFRDNVRPEVPVQVTLTPVGNPAGLLCVAAKDENGFSAALKTISGWSGDPDVAFDWIAIGTLREPETSAEAKAEQENENRERTAALLRLTRERQE